MRRSLKFSTVTIGQNGTISDLPGTISVATGDWVVWVVKNESGSRATLKLKDFKIKDTGKPVTVIEWLKTNHGSVDNDDSTIVAGKVTFVPDDDALLIKYTIGVTGPGKHDYDPDLEVSPPN